MKCPTCQAKLLPVDGQMFCLQCGETSAPQPGADNKGPVLEETSDPVLQRAIVDAVQHEVTFRLPVSQAAPPTPKTTAFKSMRAVLETPRPALAVAGGDKLEASTMALDAGPINLLPERAVQAVQRPHVSLPLGWRIGLAVFAGFVLANAGLSWFYASHVYPGVTIGGVAVGNLPYTKLTGALGEAARSPQLTADVGGRRFVLDLPKTKPDLSELEQTAREAGHNVALPLAGVVRTAVSPEITTGESLDQASAERIARGLAVAVSYQSAAPVELIHNGQAFMIGARAGQALDVTSTAKVIRQAYGKVDVVKLTTQKTAVLSDLSGYEYNLSEAKNRLALTLQLKTKSEIYTPTPTQIGQWLAFNLPGNGVTVDGARVSAYVAGLPGSFDRVAATAALVTAVSAKQPLSYTVVAKNPKAAPKLAAIDHGWPRQTYGYCLPVAMKPAASEAFTALSGWTLGGQLAFSRMADGCNLAFELVPARSMGDYGTDCKAATTCLAGNLVVVNADKWSGVPSGWKGTLEDFRSQVVTQAAGHWLGFDRATCLGASAVTYRTAPVVSLGGCSPDWFVPTVAGKLNDF